MKTLSKTIYTIREADNNNEPESQMLLASVEEFDSLDKKIIESHAYKSPKDFTLQSMQFIHNVIEDEMLNKDVIKVARVTIIFEVE